MSRRHMLRAHAAIAAALAMGPSADVGPIYDGLRRALPEPKPPREFTEADRERIAAAEAKRARRAAKRRGQP